MNEKVGYLNVNEVKVPWEPYRAAIDKNKKLKKTSSFYSSNNEILNKSNSCEPNHTLINELNKNDLIKYKIETDLEVFNSKRPGYQFDESDLDSVDKKLNLNDKMSILNKLTSNNADSVNLIDEKQNDKLPPNFIDARFYTDFHFLKLADELKKKSLNSSFKSGNNSTSPINSNNKPINVVGPMIEKKKLNESSSISPSTKSSATNLSSSSETNSIKLWKQQRDLYENKINYLESQLNGFYEQLQVQTQVNAELKKLLVASIGEDMQYKLERLLNDKLRLEMELSNMSKNLDNLNDELEQVTIQCDLWRSKFLASKLMNEEMSTWKTFLILLNRENEKIIDNLLNDSNLLNNKLSQAMELLNQLNQSNSNEDNLMKIKNSTNNIQLANSILSKLNSFGLTPTKTKSIKTNFRTNNEYIAEQMMEQFKWLNSIIAVKVNTSDINFINSSNKAESYYTNTNDLCVLDSLEKLENLISVIKLKRAKTHSRLFQTANSSETNFLLNVCNNCKGEIKIV